MILDFLLDGANWGFVEGFPQRILEHLGYTAIAMALAFAIAYGIVRSANVALYVLASRDDEPLAACSRPRSPAT